MLTKFTKLQNPHILDKNCPQQPHSEEKRRRGVSTWLSGCQHPLLVLAAWLGLLPSGRPPAQSPKSLKTCPTIWHNSTLLQLKTFPGKLIVENTQCGPKKKPILFTRLHSCTNRMTESCFSLNFTFLPFYFTLHFQGLLFDDEILFINTKAQ